MAGGQRVLVYAPELAWCWLFVFSCLDSSCVLGFFEQARLVSVPRSEVTARFWLDQICCGLNLEAI